jgi:hypothetical protein
MAFSLSVMACNGIPAAAQTRPALVVVQNTGAQPVPVANVADPAYSPLRLRTTATVPAGFVGSFGIPVGSSVAADSRYVVEFCSVQCGTSGAIEASNVWVSVAEKIGVGSFSFHTYPVPLSRTVANYSGAYSVVASQSQRWYHDGGQAVQVGITLTGAAPAGGISCQVEVSGFTVPMP